MFNDDSDEPTRFTKVDAERRIYGARWTRL